MAAIAPEDGKAIVHWASLSPDGNTAYAIVVGGVVPGTNNINYWLVGWNVATAAETLRIEARGPMAVSPDGKFAAVASSQDMGSVEVIDLKAGKTLHSLKGHHVAMPQYRTSAIRDLAWSADGTTLLSGGGEHGGWEGKGKADVLSPATASTAKGTPNTALRPLRLCG